MPKINLAITHVDLQIFKVHPCPAQVGSLGVTKHSSRSILRFTGLLLRQLQRDECRYVRKVSFDALGAYMAAVCAGNLLAHESFAAQRLGLKLIAMLSEVANCLVSRSCLLILLTKALGGTWMLEQPASSRLCWYPRFEYVVMKMKCFRVGWWMRLWGSLSPSLGSSNGQKHKNNR